MSQITTSREERLNALIADYLDRDAAGQAPDRTAWLADHAEFAGELRQFLDEHERMARLGSPLRALAVPGAAANAATIGGAADTAIAPPIVRSFGDYELLEEIARGGMGVVYKARQKSLNRLVALKMILAGQLATPTDVQRFRAEAAAAAQLDHANIVPIYDVDQHDGQHYFSMKLIEGESLAQAIAGNRWPRQTHDGQRLMAALIAQTARAVHYAHQRGILHRDLKPANILLAKQESGVRSQGAGVRGQESEVRGQKSEARVAGKLTPDSCLLTPVLTDFGLAKRVGGEATLTNTGAIVGTPAYMPPEQASGKKQLSVAADVYSLGAILYEMLTGRPPFQGDSALSILSQVCSDDPAAPLSLNAALDRDLGTICSRCLEKDPSRRYPSALALAEDLQRWLDGEPIEARPATAWERTAKWAKRRPAVAALVGVSIVSAAALLIGGLFFNAQLQLALGQVREQQRDLNNTKIDLDEAKGKVAEQEQQATITTARAQELLAEATSLRLVNRSEVVRRNEPALALLLALEGAKLGPRRAAQNNALAKALVDCREVGPLLQAGDGFDVRMVRWFADGRRVLTISWATVRIWDVKSGKKLVEFDGPHLRIASFALSPDEQWLALTFADHYEHDVVEIDGQQVRDRFLVTGQAVRVYDVQTGAEVQVLRGHQHLVDSVAFSADGKRIVTASRDATARIWDVKTGQTLRVLEGHACGLAWAEFTGDGRVLTTSSGIKRRKQDNPLQRLRDRFPAASVDPPLPKAFRSHSGSSSATGGFGGIDGEEMFACLWDPETGAKIRECRTTQRLQSRFPFHSRLDPSGKHLVAATGFSGATVWDVQTGKEVHALKYQDEPIGPPIFNAAGNRVLIVFRRAVRVWSVTQGNEQGLATLASETDEFRSARFSPDPDGRYLLTASEDTTARVWETASGTELFSLRGHEQGVIDAAFSADGRRAITGSNDRSARIWNVEPRNHYGQILDDGLQAWWVGPKTLQPGHLQKKAIWAAAFSPNGQRIATGSYDGSLHLVDAKSGKLLTTQRGYEQLKNPKLQNQLLREIFAISYNQDGTRLLTVSADYVTQMVDAKNQLVKEESSPLPHRPVRIHDAETGKEVCTLEGHREGVRYAQFSPDGSRVLTVAESDRIAILRVDPSGNVRGSGSGGGSDRTVRIFDASTGKQLHAFAGDWREVYSACWDAKGERVCIVHDGFGLHGIRTRRVAAVWDVKTATQTHQLSHDKINASMAQFSPDGRRLLTWHDTHNRQSSASGQANEALVWDLASSQIVFSLKGPSGVATFAAYSPDGKSIVTGAFVANSFTSGGGVGVRGRVRDTYFADRTAHLWDAETGALRFVLSGHERAVHAAAFSQDSRWLVTCSEDRTARVWEAATGKEWISLSGHEDAVKTAAFSPDAKSVLTVSWDGTARLWPVDPLPLAQARQPRALTAEERERFEVEKGR